MRLPLVPQIDSRDGTDDKDCLHKNLLIEHDNQAQLASVRPGLRTVANNTGDGRGIVDFQGELLSIYGATLAVADIPSRIGYGLLDITELNTGAIPFQAVPYHMSFDGKVCVGYYITGSPTTYTAFRWSKDVGLEGLGQLSPGKLYSEAKFCTDDGLTVIGVAANASNVRVPFKWVDGSGMSAISGFSSNTVITCANAECTTFAGTTGSSRFVWTESGGVTTVGSLSVINDCSDDGSVVVGSGNFGGVIKAARWASGVVTVLNNGTSSANCCSADGTVIFGFGPHPSNPAIPTPFRYSGGVYTEILPGYRGSVYACSEDGQTCCGTVLKDGVYIAFRWDRGVVKFIDIFTDFGGQTTTTGTYPTHISHDGSVVSGRAYRIDPPDTAEITWTWFAETNTIYSEMIGYNSWLECGGVSGDGWVTYDARLPLNETGFHAYLFSPDTGQFRTVAALDDDFYDFVESV